MEINTKEARNKLSFLLKRVEDGDEIIVIRRGKKVARIIPFHRKEKQLPRLKEFRASIKVKGELLSDIVCKSRKEARY